MNIASLYKYEVVLLNIRGARSNKQNLESYLAEMNYPEVVCLNETKLPCGKRFEIDGYTISARREHNSTGGSRGSMILTRNDIKDVIEIDDVKNFHEEIIGIHLQKTTQRPALKIFTYYNPPLTAPSEAIIQLIANIPEACILTGDLNCKNTIWGSSKTDNRGDDLLDHLNRYNLVLYNDDSKTRSDPATGKEESLDLIAGNLGSAKYFRQFWVGFDVGSDHYPVHSIFQFRNPSNDSSSSIKTRKIQKLNNTKWNKLLKSQPSLFPSKTAEELDHNATSFTKLIKDVFEKSCPLTTIKKKSKCTFTPEIKEKVKEKRRLRREKNLAAQRQDEQLVRQIMTRINRLGNEIKKLQKIEQKKMLERHCESLNKETNPRKFYETFALIADPQLNDKSTESLHRPIEDELGNRASTNQDKASLFANRLQRVHQEPEYDGFDESWKASVETFIAENEDAFKTKPDETYWEEESGDDSDLCQEVSIDEFDMNLVKCKNRSAVGHDGISYLLMKKLPIEAKKNLCQIYSDAVRIGHFPKEWKIALVKMVPKPNKDTKSAKSYRPISLLSCVGKVLERIIASRLSKYMEEKKMFSNSQSGFRSHRMTTEQLLRLSEQSHIGFKKQQTTAALFLDAEAAFDRCWHNGIRYKLKKNLNLPNRTIRLLSSFLTDRTLKVVYEGCSSHLVYLNAGTPQGSPLSPLIYIIYVNDYPDSIERNCSLSQFADDTAIWATTYTRSMATKRLQDALNCLEGWCRRWRVKLNGEKSNLLFISRNREITTENHALQLFNDLIRPVKSAKFLGIEIDDQLSFKNHFDTIINKTTRKLSVLKVLAYNGTKPKILAKLYKSYVRPVLEYGSIAFVAAPKMQLERLQRVQNDALRICLKLPKYIRIKLLHDYASMLSLDERFKIFNLKLLCTMKSFNPHIQDLIANHKSKDTSNLQSPLDVILNQ